MDDFDELAELEEIDSLLEAGSKEQQCRGPCGRILPLDGAFFHRDKKSETGFTTQCKECVKQSRESEAGKQVIAMVGAMEKRLVDTVQNSPKIFERLASDVVLCEEIMNVFGGARGFSNLLMYQFVTSKPGSMNRTKILQMVLAFHQKVMASGKANKDTSLLTDEELDQELKSRLAGITGVVGVPDVVDAVDAKESA